MKIGRYRLYILNFFIRSSYLQNVTRVGGVVWGIYVIIYLILFGANYSPCQHSIHQFDWYCLPTFKKKGLELEGREGRGSVANNGWSLAIADGLKILVGKKNLELYKNDRPLFTHKKRDFKTAKPERSFFFLILLFNST